MSSLISLGVGSIADAFKSDGAAIPAAPITNDFSIKFLRDIPAIRLFFDLQN
jgi:hypothetical protein